MGNFDVHETASTSAVGAGHRAARQHQGQRHLERGAGGMKEP